MKYVFCPKYGCLPKINYECHFFHTTCLQLGEQGFTSNNYYLLYFALYIHYIYLYLCCNFNLYSCLYSVENSERRKQYHCALFAQDVLQLERSGQHLNYVKSCKICILLRTKYAFKRFKHYRNMKTCIFLQIRFQTFET